MSDPAMRPHADWQRELVLSEAQAEAGNTVAGEDVLAMLEVDPNPPATWFAKPGDRARNSASPLR